MTRRDSLIVAGPLGLMLVALAGCSPPATDGPESPSLSDRAIELEQEIGGRLGVTLVDAEGVVVDSHRGNERFAMCSTFKLAMAGMVLERVAEGELSLDDVIPYGESDLLAYAPVARERVGEGGMPIRDLAEAIVILSDNTAANLLLDRIGGPEAVTAFFRRHGDPTTRLDRTEPTLNENAVGDERDTTTPIAMAGLIQRLVLGSALTADARKQLQDWAVANQTGDDRIRAGIPTDWRVGDKTGSCGNASNDIGIVWPPAGEPFVLTIYIDRPTVEAPQVNGAFAELARLAAEEAAGAGVTR